MHVHAADEGLREGPRGTNRMSLGEKAGRELATTDTNLRTMGSAAMWRYRCRTSKLAVALVGAFAVVELGGASTAEAISWHSFAPSGLTKLDVPTPGIASGTQVNATTMVPTLNASGTLVLDYLSTTTNAAGNFEVYQFSNFYDTSTAWSPSAYLFGLSQDAYYTAGVPWGIGISNYLWQCEGGDTCFTNTWPEATSVASWEATTAGQTNAGYLLATHDAITVTSGSGPHGQLIKCFVVGSGGWDAGTWHSTGYGAAQVVGDTANGTYAYALDSS